MIPLDKVLYISGPMSGIKDFNFPAFHSVAKTLRELGYTVINCAELDDGDTSREWTYYLRRDIIKLMDSHVIVVLPGWENSKGANLEIHIGKALGMEIVGLDLKPLPQESILMEAERLTNGARLKSYGHPREDFGRTANMATGLGFTFQGLPLQPQHVGMFMILVKLSRETNKHGRDNLTDLCGYSSTIMKILES